MHTGRCRRPPPDNASPLPTAVFGPDKYVRTAHPIERAVGMEWYVSDADGFGGRLRAAPADFRVREIESFAVEPLDADPGGYQHVVLRATLDNVETNAFASALSDRLGISRERVSWAGTKDKRAVTTQLFSVDGIDPGEVPDVPSAEIEAIGRAGRPVLFGDLAGNEFEITVRDVEVDDPADAAASVTDDLAAFAGTDDDGLIGVPNYFGQQRFGSRRPVTHEVGLAIARDDWEGAVLAYVGSPHEREPEATQAAREYVEETRDWKGAIEKFPRALGYERSMCHRLVENGAEEPADFRDALETLPSNLQSLMVNAAQSYLFNLILSERLERGLPFDRPVAGDVVCFRDSDAPDELALPDTDRIQRVTEDRLATVERHCKRGRAYVTAPLIGTETELGDGEPGDIERSVLDEVGIERADFDLPGAFDSSGTRRAIQVRTDLDVAPVDDGVLQFDFSLPKGSYATVILREYLKLDPEALS